MTVDPLLTSIPGQPGDPIVVTPAAAELVFDSTLHVSELHHSGRTHQRNRIQVLWTEETQRAQSVTHPPVRAVPKPLFHQAVVWP